MWVHILLENSPSQELLLLLLGIICVEDLDIRVDKRSGQKGINVLALLLPVCCPLQPCLHLLSLSPGVDCSTTTGHRMCLLLCQFSYAG